MIRIPMYEQQTRVGGAEQSRASPVQVTDPMGAAIGDVGKALQYDASALANEQAVENRLLKHQQEEDAKAYAGKALSDAHVQWQETLQKRMEAAPAGAPGFTPALLKDFDDWTKTAVEQAPTAASREYLTQHLLSYRTQLAGHAISFESQARVGSRMTDFTASVDNWATTVARDPGKYQLAMSALEQTLPTVGPLNQEKMREYMRKTLSQGVATGMIQSDPEAAYNLLTRSTLPAAAGAGRDKTGTIQLPAGALPDWVSKIAAEEGADPRLVAAIYAQESGKGKNARTSVDGAVGGFQVIPDTFKRVMKGQGDINNEQDNARAGIRLISQLQGKFGVDPVLVGAAYFSGEGNVTPGGIVNPNRTDGNGKSVQSYAADIGRKFAAFDTGTRIDAGTEPVQFGPGVEPVQPGAGTSDAKTGVPWIDAMNLQERLHYLQQADGEVRRRQQVARADLELKEKDQNSQALAGKPVSAPLSLPDYVKAYGQVEGPRRYGEFVDNQQFGANVQQVAIMSPAEQSALLAKNTPVPNTPGFAQDQQRFELLQRAVDHANKLRAQDPLGFSVEHKTATINGIDFSDPQSIAGELPRRTTIAAQNVSKYGWGTPYQVLTSAEAGHLAEYLGSLQAKDQARVLGQIAAAGGPDSLLAISGQLKDKHDTLAIAGTLASRSTTVGRNVAELYLEGKEMIAQKRAKIDDKAETGLKAEIFKALDGVYMTPQAMRAAQDASYAIYAKLKSEGNDDRERAIRLATGGIMDHNGAKIAKPYGMSDTDFRTQLATQGTRQVNSVGTEFIVGDKRMGAVAFAASLPGAKLQTFGDGTYLVKAGADVVRQADGRPFVLKIATGGS